MSLPEMGHITLNGQDYRIDLPSYRVSDLVDFAPRAATPGGSILHSELGLYQPLMMTDWRHGFGFQWYSDAMGYMRTEGYVDTRHAGVAMMMTQVTSSDTNNAVKEGFNTFNNILYAYGATLRKFTGGTWSDDGGYVTSINHILSTGSYLFVSRTGARLRKIDTSGNHTDAGLNASSAGYKWLVIFNGFIYAGMENTNRIHYSDSESLADLEGTTADPDVIYVGAGGIPTIGAQVYGGKLYVFRRDGMWTIEDRLAKKVIDYSDQISSTNFRSWAVHNGMLVFPVRDRVKQWNGVRLADITPPQTSDLFPYTTYGRFDNFVVVDSFLYCTARSSVASYVEDLLCFDGTGWHRLASLLTGGTGQVTAMGYDVINNRMWYHVDLTSDATYYISMQDLSSYPYANFPTSGTHSLISSRLDMGFRRVTKSMPSIMVEASNVTANRYLTVYYQLDGSGTWTSLGNVTANGVTTLSFASSGTVEFKYLQLRVDFVTDSTTQTPVLEGLTVRFIMRPDTAYGYNFVIIGQRETMYGGLPDNRTAKEIIDDLHTARASKAPISFTDIHGTVHKVYVSQIVEQATEMHLEIEQEIPNVEFMIRVNLVEVG